MRVLIVAHAVPGDASVAAARIGWLVKDLAPFGVDTFLLALRPQWAKMPADRSVAPPECIESVAVADNRNAGWREALSRAAELNVEQSAVYWPVGIFVALIRS